MLVKSLCFCRNMELNYWMSTFRTVTTQSSLLTGFCFAGMRGAAGCESLVLSFFYLAVTASSMGFGLLCITTASFVSLIKLWQSSFSPWFLVPREHWWANKHSRRWIRQFQFWKRSLFSRFTSSWRNWPFSFCQPSFKCGLSTHQSWPWQQTQSLRSQLSSLSRMALSWLISYTSRTMMRLTRISETKTTMISQLEAALEIFGMTTEWAYLRDRSMLSETPLLDLEIRPLTARSRLKCVTALQEACLQWHQRDRSLLIRLRMWAHLRWVLALQNVSASVTSTKSFSKIFDFFIII